MSRKNGKQSPSAQASSAIPAAMPLFKRIIARAFNPDQLTPEERNALFVVRKPLFDRIYRDIINHPADTMPQHWLIQGVRGSGKTTLLLKIYDELCANTDAEKRIVTVRLNEEQHGIFKLSRLWEKVLELLQDEYGEEWRGVYDEAEQHFNDDDYEERSFEYLLRPLRERKKSLVLLIDNFGVMLDKFSTKEHQHLRSLLMTCPELRIIAASANVLEHTYRYDKPFFDFFATVQLKGLKQSETIELLKNLAKYRSKEEQENVLRIITTQPRRIEILRTLTGGFPRTMVLLFDIFADSTGGDSVQDLERLLDQLTPFYVQRVEDLPSQQRVVVDAVALAWDAVSVKELVAKTRLESKVISAQLNTLEQQGIIEKVPTSTKNYFYRLQEQFFNIWYLMRNGTKAGRRSVIWFVRFLEMMPEEILHEKAATLVDSIHNGQSLYPRYAYLLAEGLAQSGKLEHDIQDKLLAATKEYLLQHSPSLAQNLSESDKVLSNKSFEIFEQGANNEDIRKMEEAISIMKNISNQDSEVLLATALMYATIGYSYGIIGKEKKSMLYMLKAIKSSITKINAALEIYLTSPKLWGNKSITKQITEALKSVSEHEASIEENLFRMLEGISQMTLAEIQERMRIILADDNVYDLYFVVIWNIIFRFIRDKQYHVALTLFMRYSGLKEKMKPLWYALMYFLRDEFPDEYLRMGEEHKEIVEKIITVLERLYTQLAELDAVFNDEILQ